ncbi:hypothetical protein DdX_07395 [Ditylenchus destructor]|uniref:SWIM-type domain-containing protein n=1 Tax=Ditylenchus destructor TaxID=166010 RepID=A0AAD4N458_9BILA|nr:hypothetical protein DdX_07395 [Ditylenchus destructor]
MPLDENDTFVIGHRIIANGNSLSYFLIWSTRKLYRMLGSQPLLQIDATHGMVWQSSAKVNIIGFSDLNHKFFPAALCVSSAETIEIYEGILGAMYRPLYVLADGDAAITAAVKNSFAPPPRRLMCYPHMIRCVDRKLNELRISGDVRQDIKSDIQLLQVATAPLVFTKAAELLLESWIERWPIDNEIGEKVSSFATYFLNTWIDSPLKNWFEGASPVISNNSGLESANKNLKDRHVFRRQTPFSQFVEAAEKIPAEWSSQPEFQTPAVDYKIDRDVLFKAFTLSKERRTMAHQGTRYILPATGTLYSAPECQSWIAAYVAGTNLDAYLTNWNDYKDTRFKYHAVKAREREAFLCTCQIGIKKELCKHILLVKHEKGEFRWPEEFAALPLNTKFTGRPRKRQLVTRYQGN